jgi:hypothetical protein
VKRLIPLALVGCLALAVWGAAPEYNNWCNRVSDTLTVDSQFTGMWKLIDSIAVIKTDTCYTIYTISGIAELHPGQRLYIGFIDGGGAPAATSTAADTFIFENNAAWQAGIMYVPFVATYLDSLVSQDDLNDTIYFMAASAASNQHIMLTNVLLRAQVVDFNAAGVVGE